MAESSDGEMEHSARSPCSIFLQNLYKMSYEENIF